MSVQSLNDDDRRGWVLNNEPLYLRWQAMRVGSRPQGLGAFVRANRREIDQIIRTERDRPPLS